MALPTSGPLSIDDIATEFGGAAPHGLTEYYAADDNVPASGEIAITDFYGASNIPPPVARLFYERFTHNGASKGCLGSHAVVRSAGSRGNYNYTSTFGNPDRAYTGCQVLALDGGAYMYWWNPGFYHRQHPAQYNGILDTDRLCRIQFRFYAGYGNTDILGSPSHVTYGKLTSTAGNSTLDSRSGSDANSGLRTYTTTQNLQWYIDNNEYLQWTVYGHSGDTNNCGRTIGNGNLSLDIVDINFVI